MALEQAEIAEGVEIDWRADLYALSVVAYEMLVGKPPFTGSSPTAVLYKHVYEAPPRPTALNPALLPGMEPVLLKGLAKKREDRFQKASDFARQLRQATLVRQGAPSPIYAGPQRPSRAGPSSRPRTRLASINIPTWLVVGAIILLLVGSLGLTAVFGFLQEWWGPATPTATVRVTDEPTRPPTAVPTDTPTAEVLTDEPTDDEVTTKTQCVFNAAVVQFPDLPSGSQVDPGEQLVLNWRLTNTGDCLWETGTQLIPLTDGLQPEPVDVSTASLSPGGTMDALVRLQAPWTPGIYEMLLQLQAPDASLFGPRIGFVIEVVSPPPSPTFTPIVVVVPPTETPFIATPTFQPTDTPFAATSTFQPTKTPFALTSTFQPTKTPFVTTPTFQLTRTPFAATSTSYP